MNKVLELVLKAIPGTITAIAGAVRARRAQKRGLGSPAPSGYSGPSAAEMREKARALDSLALPGSVPSSVPDPFLPERG